MRISFFLFVFGETIKPTTKVLLQLIMMVDPIAMLNVYPINNPNIDDNEPNIAAKISIVFRRFEYKYAVAAGVISSANNHDCPDTSHCRNGY